MRKVCSVLIGIFFTLAFTTCKQFTENIEDYLSYWSAEAHITEHRIEAVTQTDGAGIASVASEKDVIVALTVQNPKSFKLVMPSASESRRIIDFTHLTKNKPALGGDYTLEQTAPDTVKLTYKQAFLQRYEWGTEDIGAEITLIAEDGRVFKKTFTMNLKANTQPPKPDFTVAKTIGTPAYYVLCIAVPDEKMKQTVQGGALLHKDITRIEVNGAPYTFSVDEAHNTFIKPESDLFITASAVEKLTESNAEEVPTGRWVLYYKTDVEVKDGAAKKEYTVRLADAKGLVSGILNASTKPNKAEAEIIRITKGTKSSGNGSSDSDPVIIASDSTGAELTISSATGGTTVHCTLTGSGAVPVKYDGNPVTVPLPLDGAGEKNYKLEYYTDGEGFATTAVKTVYYRITSTPSAPNTYTVNGGSNDAWKKLRKVINEAPAGGTVIINGLIQATNDGSGDDANNDEIVINKNIAIKGKTGSNTDILDANKDTDGKPKHRIFKVDGAELTLENITLTGGIAPTGENGGAIYAKDATVKMTGCTLTGNTAGGSGGGVCAEKATVKMTNCTLTKNTAGGSGGGIVINGSTNNTITNCTITGNKANEGNGGGVCAGKSEGTTPSTVTISGGTIGGEGTDANKAPSSIFLLGNGGGIFIDAGCTVTLEKGVQVIGNEAKNGGGGVYATGNTTERAVITIDGGTINANTVNGSFGAGGGIYVKQFADLTLKGAATVTGNTATAKGGGVCSGPYTTVTVNNCNIMRNTAQDGGGMYAIGINISAKSIVTITGGTITANTAKRHVYGMGGGIYVDQDTEVTLNGTATVTGNTAADKGGGGVYVKDNTATFTLSGKATVDTGDDVYLAGAAPNNAMITVNGALTGTAPVARITVPDSDYQTGTQVLTGSAVSSNHTKFTVTPQTSPAQQGWEVDSEGKLQKK